MDDHRVQSTLLRLQSVFEDKVDRIEHLRKQIRAKEDEIHQLSSTPSSYNEAANIQLISARRQCTLADLYEKAEETERLLNTQKERYLENANEIEEFQRELSELICTMQVSKQSTLRHHDSIQNLYRSRREVLRMMAEEISHFDWLINSQQACDAVADEMMFAEMQRHLSSLQSARMDIENQIYLHLPRRI